MLSELMDTIQDYQEEETEQELDTIGSSSSSDKYDRVIALDSRGEIVKSSKGPKGRPVIHPFAGRITLLRKEVQDILKNPIQFALLMEESHSLSEDRIQVLGNKYSDNEIDYTYCGPISIVIDEVLEKLNQYEKNDKVESIKVDFKKKKIIPDTTSSLYLQPEMDGKIIKKQEAYPDRIYGYIKIKLKS